MRQSIARLSTAATPYGSYSVLDPTSAMTTYPTIRPVPSSIPRPAYVPKNFFDAGWGDHDEIVAIKTPSQEEGRLNAKDMRGVRAVGKMAAEILREAGKLVKVCTVFCMPSAQSTVTESIDTIGVVDLARFGFAKQNRAHGRSE